MSTAKPFDLKASQIAVLSKTEVINYLMNFKGRFTLDFTKEYLQNLNVNHLRHILFAAIITNSKPGYNEKRNKKQSF